MFCRAAQQLLQSVVLDSAHHDHIHLLLADKIAQRRDRVTENEMPTVSGHAVLTGQFDERLFLCCAQLVSDV